MTDAKETTLMETRETRRSAGLVWGVLAPIFCVAVMGAVPYLELTLLGMDKATEIAAGVGVGAVLLLLWWVSFWGRQHITITNERVLVESGFWNKVRDDVEVFRIRDVVVTRSLWQRVLGIGDIVVKATEGRGQPEEVHLLKGVPGAVAVAETIRKAWNQTGRPRQTTNVDG